MSKGHVSVKRSKIDWNRIKIRIVPVDTDHPNERNPYAKLSPGEREKAIVSAFAKIWCRHIRVQQEILSSPIIPL